MEDNFYDILGFADDGLGDLLSEKPKRKSRKKSKGKTYQPLKEPKGGGHPDGIFRLWKRKEKTYLKECLICDKALHNTPGAGRKRTICAKNKCFRAYRNAYRLDYDAQRPS